MNKKEVANLFIFNLKYDINKISGKYFVNDKFRRNCMII